MTLDILDTLEGATERIMTPVGGWLITGFFLLGLLNQFVGTNFFVSLVREYGIVLNNTPPFYVGSMDLRLLGGLLVLMVVLGMWYSIVVIRALLEGRTETIPRTLVTEDILPRVVHLMVGGIASMVLIGVSSVFLIIPGIYVMLGLMLYPVILIERGCSFVEAFQESWTLAEGNRWRLLGIGLVVGFIGLTLSIIGSMAGSAVLFAPDTGRMVAQTLMTGAATVFQWSVMVEVYRRLSSGS